MTVVSTVKNLLSPTKKGFFSRPPRRVDRICIVARDVLIHCHLLECFVNVQREVTAWAAKHKASPQQMWRFYINMAVQRFVRWLEASYNTDMTRFVPPVDVLLVWHAFLQNPAHWDDFATRAHIGFSHWNRDELYLAVTHDDGTFSPSFQSRDMIRAIYEAPILRDTLDVLASFLISSRPDHTTIRLRECFLRDEENFSINAPCGAINFKFDVHAAVRKQLDFASSQLLRFSWHRAQESQIRERQFGPFIERYLDILTLIPLDGVTRQTSSPEDMSPSWPVPMLDMDLVWRTHLLFPNDYRWFCDGVNGGILAHIPSTSTVDHLTSTMYQHELHKEYEICLCWSCVAGRATPSQGISPLKWHKRKAIREAVGEEHNMRDVSVAGVSLAFTSKQCRECGSHPKRSCRAKAVAKTAMSQRRRRESVDSDDVSSETTMLMASPLAVEVVPVPAPGDPHAYRRPRLSPESHQFQLLDDATETPPAAFWEQLFSSSPSPSHVTTTPLSSSESEMGGEFGPFARRASAPADSSRAASSRSQESVGYRRPREDQSPLAIKPSGWLAGN